MRLNQINLNKSILANTTLCQIIKRDVNTVYLIQEPYFTTKGRLPGLPKGYSLFGDYNCRAIIIAPSRMPLYLCHELSHPDCTVCLYDDGTNKKYLISMYLDCKKEVISREFLTLLETLQDLQTPAIFGLDSNAHSTFWGCAESNPRGIALEELIVHFNLKVLNVGIEPTWQDSRNSSIIDITLTMGKNRDVKGWHISDKILHSDHRMLELYFLDKTVSPTMTTKVSWESFKNNLLVEDRYYNKWTPVTIETEAAALTAAMTNALTKSSYTTRQKSAETVWWSDSLNSQSAKVNKLWIAKQKYPSASNREKYLEEKRLFCKNIKKAKRKSWQQFSDSINDPNAMARFNSIVQGKAMHKIGLLKNKDGTFARDIKDSISILMEAHFPESVSIPKRDGTDLCQSRYYKKNERFCSMKDLKDSFITEERVSAAINSFGDFKTPGPDNLKPMVLKRFIWNKIGLRRLTTLFKAIVELGYTPNAWCEAKVIFIPKLGKKDYSEARSFRPISLLNFLFKTVERLVLWEIEYKVLREKPLLFNQHAFRKGFSTETALSSLITEVEKSIYQNEFCLVASLDVRGAFDVLRYKDITAALKRRNTPNHIIRWYEKFLRNRRASVTFSDIEKCFKLQAGTAQGGVLSPTIWCLAFESFIKTMHKGPIKAYCYADDACLAIMGPDVSSLVDKMQIALNKAQDWGNRHGLIFVPEKTTAILFRKKMIKTEPKKLKMGNHEIDYSPVIKYLGVYLDQRLNWDYHLNERIKKARSLFIKVRNSIGSYWGPSPLAMKWAINGIIVPMISYASIVWSRVCDKVMSQNKLRRLHNFMMSALMPIRRSSPIRGLEIILNMSPLHLKIKNCALKAALRVIPITKESNIIWTGQTKQGHLADLKSMLRKLGIAKMDFDSIKDTNLWKDFSVDYDSFKSGLPNSECNIKCYTDGSKFSGRTGYGFVITCNSKEVKSENGYLGTQATVFQAEITAIQKCAEALAEEENFPEVIIYSDSQAALSALTSLTIKHKSVRNCISALNKAASIRKIKLAWVKAHADHPGNELADHLAKTGTANTNNTVVIATPLSWATAKIDTHTHKTWNEEWWLYKEADQTKYWFPNVNKQISHELIRLSRKDLGLMVQLLTGHNRLRYHQFKVDPSSNPNCRECKTESETAVHVMGDCPAFKNRRMRAFDREFLENYPVWNLTQFLKFVRLAKLQELNNGGAPDLTHA